MADYETETYKAQTDKPVQSTKRVGQTLLWADADIGDEDWTAQDTVKLFRLPPNAIPVIISYRFEAFGSSVSVDIGNDDDSDAYVDGLSISSATQGARHPKLLKKVGGDGDVTLTFSNNNPTDDAHMYIGIGYTIGN